MFQVRFHGRGGQGVVTAAELLSVAAFHDGRHAQAFPVFGSERTGAPVMAFCRIDDQPIRTREPIIAPGRARDPGPDAAARVDVFAGFDRRPVLVNTSRDARVVARAGWSRCPRASSRASTSAARCPARRCSARWPRRPASSRSTRSSAAIRERFPAAVADGNVAAARAAYDGGAGACLGRSRARARSPRRSRCAGRRSSAPIRSRRRRTSSRGSPRW